MKSNKGIFLIVLLSSFYYVNSFEINQKEMDLNIINQTSTEIFLAAKRGTIDEATLEKLDKSIDECLKYLKENKEANEYNETIKKLVENFFKIKSALCRKIEN